MDFNRRGRDGSMTVTFNNSPQGPSTSFHSFAGVYVPFNDKLGDWHGNKGSVVFADGHAGVEGAPFAQEIRHFHPTWSPTSTLLDSRSLFTFDY
jgi:prepilin-type processing-associated H-X9-DG protein